MIDYEPIGWINRETARTTPTSAANFNHMDEGIEQATNFANETREKVDELESRQSIQEARMDTIASLPSGSVSTKGDAELNDIRSGYDGSVYTTAGNAVRGQAKTLQRYIDALEAANAVLSGQIENLVQTSSEATVGNEELIDIRTGYDGTVYNTAGTAVREQISAVITKVENTDNTKTVTQEEYDALSEEEKTNGTIYFITDGGGVRQAATVEYDNERSGLTGTTVQAAIDEAAEVVAGMQSQITELNSRTNFGNSVSYDETPNNRLFIRQGDTVYFSFQGENKARSEGQLLFTVPQGYRPTNAIYISGTLGVVPCIFALRENGQCSIYIAASYPTGRAYLRGSYLV